LLPTGRQGNLPRMGRRLPHMRQMHLRERNMLQ